MALKLNNKPKTKAKVKIVVGFFITVLMLIGAWTTFNLYALALYLIIAVFAVLLMARGFKEKKK